MSSSSNLAARMQASRAHHQRDYSPVPWTEYFDEAHDIQLDATQITHNAHDCRKININLDQTSHAAAPTTTTTNKRNSFRVYLRNFKPPLAPPREPAQVLDATRCDLSRDELDKFVQYPTLVMLHGGGYSALTWAQFTQSIEQKCRCRILAMDLRSHGDTQTTDDERMDSETLVDDVIQVTHASHRICGFPETPKIIFIGHSMGGAIAVKSSMRCAELLPSLAGFVIIDVVEGTAKDALPLMMSVINTRPAKFPNLSHAIEWSVRSGMAKNVDAARVSMPGNLLNVSTGHLSTHDINSDQSNQPDKLTSNIKKHKFHISLENLLASAKGHHVVQPLPRGLPLVPRIASLRNKANHILPMVAPQQTQPSVQSGVIAEEELPSDVGTTMEQSNSDSSDNVGDPSHPDGSKDQTAQVDGDGHMRPPPIESSGYCWRTDLAKTQPYWNGWFDGLSEQLLAAPVQGKFLLLAGIDRLDKTLTIGQMQGKFMMRVLPKCGHAVHEDVPDQVATVISQFLVKNKFTSSDCPNR